MSKRKTLKLVFLSITTFLVLLFICFEYSNESLAQFQNKLAPTHQSIEKQLLTVNNTSSINYIGYSKANITPTEKVKLVGYGDRKHFEGVHDSLYVRTILITNNDIKTAFISLDLMLITPIIEEKIKNALKPIGVNNIYFSASHTHSSFGGYGTNLIGRTILGGLNENILNRIADKTVYSVKKSLKKLSRIESITYTTSPYSKVKNRLNKKRNFEQKFRNIYIKNELDEIINIMSNNAHPTIVSHSETYLSNDYPGQLCLNNPHEFSMFLAGTMGSITPIVYKGKTYFDKTEVYAEILLNLKASYIDTLKGKESFFLKIELPEPDLGLFISEKIKLREWLFNLIFGETEAYVNVYKLGNLLMIGLPVELSAEYYAELESFAKKKNLNLLLTTFNGTYLGYATPSKYFNISHMETREMNWLGKYGGDYFSEVVKMIIEKQ